MANPVNGTEIIPTPPKNRGGRPRKDGAPTGSLHPASPNDIAGPRLKKYFSDSPNSTQRTRSLWTWWASVPVSTQELLEAHVYRDWPVLLDPPEDWCPECKLPMAPELGKCPRCGEKLKAQEYKYIDVVLGTTPFESDQNFIDRYGAGDYHVYLNANPPGAQRRTLAEAWVKGTHDFRTYRPTDKRIDNIEQVSLTDPQNASFVAYLRANGKLPEEEREKERDEMAASAEVTSKIVEQNTMLVGRVLDAAEKRAETQTTPAAEAPRTPEEHLNDALGLVERLSKLTARPESNGKSDLATLMEIMDRLRAASDPAPYLKLIAEQGEKIHEIEMRHLNEKLDLLKSSIDKPPQTTVTTTDGTNLQSIIEKAVGKAVEKAGLGEAEDNAWYIDPLKQLMPVAIPALIAGLQTFFMPRTPMTQPTAPTANPGFPGPAPQAQLPAPQQPAQPQTQAQPQTSQASAAQQEVIHILTAIAAPVIDSLSRDMDGDDFADEFIQEHGNRAFRLISSFAPEQIAATLYQFPLIAPNMTQFPQEKVLKFAQEFKMYTPDAYDKKMAAKEAAGGAV